MFCGSSIWLFCASLLAIINAISYYIGLRYNSTWLYFFSKCIYPCFQFVFNVWWYNYSNIIMSMMSSQITSVFIVCPTVDSGADQRKHQSSVSLTFVRGIHRWPVNSLQNASNAENDSIWWRHRDEWYTYGTVLLIIWGKNENGHDSVDNIFKCITMLMELIDDWRLFLKVKLTMRVHWFWIMMTCTTFVWYMWCGDLNKQPLWRLQRMWLLVTLEWTTSREMPPLVYNEGWPNYKPMILLVIKHFYCWNFTSK